MENACSKTYKNFHIIGSTLFLGRGKSKKEAKRLAAHQMWQRLQDLPTDSQDDVADEVSISRAMVLEYHNICSTSTSYQIGRQM